MPPISFLDSEKRLLRLAIWWFKRKYQKGGNKASVADEMEYCGNPVIRKLYKLLQTNINKLDGNHQKEAALEVSEFLTWILYKDTAYRDPFFYILKHALDMKDELMPDIMKYYKPPKEWYCNIWIGVKNKSDKLKKDGVIPDVPHRVCKEEEYFVPRLMEQKLKNMDEYIKKEKQSKGIV